MPLKPAPPSQPLARVQVPRFLPSYNGYQFAASALTIGGAPADMGMCLSVADFYVAGQRPPQVNKPPSQNDPLYTVISNAQANALSHDPQRADFMHALMSPQTPASDPPGDLSYAATASRARSCLGELPRIESDLRSGVLVPLTLCSTISTDTRLVDQGSREVIAWAYGVHENPDNLTFWIYDPLLPGRDDTRLIVYLTPPSQVLDMDYSDNFEVLGFVRFAYAPSTTNTQSMLADVAVETVQTVP